MKNNMGRNLWIKAFGALAGLCLLALCVGVGAQTETPKLSARSLCFSDASSIS